MKKITKQNIISAIILAAGESRRFGALKQLCRLDKEPLLKVVVELVHPYFDEIILVLGYKAEEILANISFPENIKITINSEYREGMSASLTKGLSYISLHSTHFAIFLGDMPYIRGKTIIELKKVLNPFEKQIVAPVYKNRRGFPVIFSKDFRKELTFIRGDKGAREFINKEKKYLKLIKTDDPGIIRDIDIKKDLKKL